MIVDLHWDLLIGGIEKNVVKLLGRQRIYREQKYLVITGFGFQVRLS